MRKLLSLAIVIGVLGCGGSDSTAPDQAVLGDYLLTQVNGQATPMIYVQDITGKVEILGGSMTLRSDHTYNQTLSVRTTRPDGTTQTSPIVENGTFTANSQQIIFTIPGSGSVSPLSYPADVAGTVVTYTFQTDTYRFEKQ
ncbi:MAG TPA: hypothetical protein VGD02_12835 [Gemmatimonadaceae bacterium]